jgi:hypothetical protein
MGLRWLDVLMVVVYMVALVAIGFRFSRRQTTTEAYFIARRSIPSWALGISMLATIISAVTFVAYPGAGYAGDWSMLVPGIMVVVLAMVGALVIPFYRRVVGMSAYEYFGSRFGYGARLYSWFAFSVSTFSKWRLLFTCSRDHREHNGMARRDDHYRCLRGNRLLHPDWRPGSRDLGGRGTGMHSLGGGPAMHRLPDAHVPGRALCNVCRSLGASQVFSGQPGI